MYVEPIDTDVQVTAEYQWYNRGWQDPEIEEDGAVVNGCTTSGKGFYPFLAYAAPSDSHNLYKIISYI